MKHSGLMFDSGEQRRTLYSLRHTYATRALVKGVDIHTLARQMGTSVLILEKHYSKITPMLSADKLA
jgi:integrase